MIMGIWPSDGPNAMIINGSPASGCIWKPLHGSFY